MHRRVAYFFYWFSVYKPFSIIKSDGAYQVEIPKEKRYVRNFFNELFAYRLIKTALSTCIIPGLKDARLINIKINKPELKTATVT